MKMREYTSKDVQIKNYLKESMNEEKFVKSNTEYLNLAKNVTGTLHDLCINGSEEYTIVTVLAGVSIGVYMFLKELSGMLKVNTQELISECVQWINWADSKFKTNN